MAIELLVTGVAILALVFISTFEGAYESLSEVSLRVMAGEREDSSRARFFRELLDHRQRLELILILGTQLSIAAIAILIADVITDTGVRAPMLIAFVAVFLAITLFRQFIPRLIAQNNPEAVIWFLLPVFRSYYRIFSVLVAPISGLLKRVKRPEEEEEYDEEEETMHGIQAFIDVGEEEGIIEESEGEMIQSIIEFGDTLVGEIMRPRPQIVAIEASATVEQARRLMIESKYSRIPVYRDVIDEVEGIVYVRDLLAYCEDAKGETPITQCIRPVYFVPESKPINELFKEMQKAKVQMAMVINEYGGVAGLVTVEDMIEEILGEIEDEDRAATDIEIVKEDDSYLVDGRAEIRKVEMLYDQEVEADDFTTVAGLLINELGHLPKVGDKLEFKGLQFEVVDADHKQVNRVRLRKIEEARRQESGSRAAE
ncbi:MAG TPA: hemolysin family protein [Blastocatellia bacterium]|jgi:CBS domain containing-hemolysin-like protein|nr:hemolysin family protein [Blastocatellia bacterium]